MTSFIITVIILLIAVYTDVRYRKIPNIIVFPSMAIGLLLCGFPFRWESYYRLIWVFFFFFLGSFRLMGMGDLKLCMAITILRGIEESSLMLFFGSISLLVYCFITERNNTLLMLKDTYYFFAYNTKIIKRSDKQYPFAVFLSIGYVLAVLTRSWLFGSITHD